MKKIDRNALIALPIVILVGLGIALAGSQGGATAFGIPIFALAVGLAFLIQWVAFVPAYLLQTEKFLDLTGSLTYITVAIIAVLFAEYESLVGSRVETLAGLTMDELREIWGRYCRGRLGHRDQAMYAFMESPELLHAAGLSESPESAELILGDGTVVEVGPADGQGDQAPGGAQGRQLLWLPAHPPARVYPALGRPRAPPDHGLCPGTDGRPARALELWHRLLWRQPHPQPLRRRRPPRRRA